MTDAELLCFQDQLRNSLTTISGTAEALSRVGIESTDYCMCQMLANVLKAEVEEIVTTCPQEWEISYPGI